MPNIQALIEPFDADGALPTIPIILDAVPRVGESITILGYKHEFKVRNVMHKIDALILLSQLVHISCYTTATRENNITTVDPV